MCTLKLLQEQSLPVTATIQQNLKAHGIVTGTVCGEHRSLQILSIHLQSLPSVGRIINPWNDLP